MPKDNKNKIILDLCGGTGAWSKPYKDAGYDVRLITLPKFNVTFMTDTEHWLYFHGIDVTMSVEKRKVYGILMAPPCTEFSRAKTTKLRDFNAGLQTVRACFDVLWSVQKDHKLAFWALENPMGLLRRFLGDPPLSFMNWWYGDIRSKQTDLWGKYNTPKRVYFEKPIWVQRTVHCRNSDWYSNQKCPDEYKHLKLTRSDIRSITSKEFAKAFFEANK